MRRLDAGVLVAALAMIALPAAADQVTIPMSVVTAAGPGNPIGVVRAADTAQGLRLTPELTGLPPGERGFHLHENGSCDAAPKDGKATAALAAGDHYDPDTTGKHLGPAGAGHQGDLPALSVAADGTATTPVVAPRLKVADLRGRSLMVHAGGDNYADQPEPLGGGGPRVACGVVP